MGKEYHGQEKMRTSERDPKRDRRAFAQDRAAVSPFMFSSRTFATSKVLEENIKGETAALSWAKALLSLLGSLSLVLIFSWP